MDSFLYDVVMPIKKEDLYLVKKNCKYIFEFLPVKRIIIITNTYDLNESFEDDRIEIIDENNLYLGLTFDKVKELERSNKYLKKKLTGYYYQQFLKLAYAYVTDDAGYLVWDADTIPIKKIEVKDMDGKPYFYMKSEYRKEYFDTMEKVLGVNKQLEKSFIVEHMYFEKDLVKEMLEVIQDNRNIEGNTWWEKIILAMEADNAFSEFETYGNYVYAHHRDSYVLRDACSLRYGKMLVGKNPTDPQLKWLSKQYESISIEHWDRETIFSYVSHIGLVRKAVKPSTYYKLSYGIEKRIDKLKQRIFFLRS